MTFCKILFNLFWIYLCSCLSRMSTWMFQLLIVEKYAFSIRIYALTFSHFSNIEYLTSQISLFFSNVFVYFVFKRSVGYYFWTSFFLAVFFDQFTYSLWLGTLPLVASAPSSTRWTFWRWFFPNIFFSHKFFQCTFSHHCITTISFFGKSPSTLADLKLLFFNKKTRGDIVIQYQFNLLYKIFSDTIIVYESQLLTSCWPQSTTGSRLYLDSRTCNTVSVCSQRDWTDSVFAFRNRYVGLKSPLTGWT